MSNIITLYDIPSAKGTAWSPNTWKARFALNYKRIPYQTVWVEYPDIEGLCKKTGIPHTSLKRDGTPFYTFPAIHDPSTGATVADSILIAKYLDETYPNTPKLFPPGTTALQHVFIDAMLPKLGAFWQFTIPGTNKILGTSSEKYFRSTREVQFGKTMEELEPSGEAWDREWAKVKAGFNDIDAWIQRGKADGPYILGSAPGFVDFQIASFLIWLTFIWGEDSAAWKDVQTWNDGRWAAFVKGLQKYQIVV